MQGRQDGRSQILAHSPVVVYEIDKLARHRNYFISCPFGVDSPGTLSAPRCGNAPERRTIKPRTESTPSTGTPESTSPEVVPLRLLPLGRG
jgi:hypothetical protein